MRGRERELGLAVRLLGAAERGKSGVLLIEGEPGIGKSELLGEVVDQAAARRFSLAKAEADALARQTPFAALLGALPELAEGLVDGGSAPNLPHRWAPIVDRIRMLLERRATLGPVLVSLDDLQHADPATLFALGLLPRQLTKLPLAWNLARCTARRGNPAQLLFDQLAGRGAARLTLGPLESEVVTAMIADLAGASPDPAIVSLASEAAGNPYLLTELVLGLRDEDAIQVTGGTARLVSARLPQRVRAAARRWLERLSQGASQMLETAAVLGSAFRLDDVALMLDRAPAVLLPLVEEAEGAGLLHAGTESFTFKNELMWRAITENVPLPARQALHRQFGMIQLTRGDSAMNAAFHLLEGARQPDPEITASLDTAVDELLPLHPGMAADLALRALEVTPATNPQRFSRTVRAAQALTAAARLGEATEIVSTALGQPQPPAGDAQLRGTLSSVLCLRGQAQEAGAEAESVLSQPHLAAGLRDEALIAQLRALTALGENARAYSLAENLLTAFRDYGEPVLAAALTVLAAVNWDDGRLDRGLHLAREATRRTSGVSPDARHFQPLFTFTAMLIDLRRIDEAQAALSAVDDSIHALRPNVAEVIPLVFRARVSLAHGHTDGARAEAENALTVADTLGSPAHSWLARSVLSAIALRKGDLRTAGLHIRNLPEGTHYLGAYAGTETVLARAQFAEAVADARAAMRVLEDVYAAVPVHRHVLVGEPTASAWLARTALAANRPELATGVVRTAEELARDNPESEVVAVAAAHCGGIVRQDPALLAHAAAQHPDPWARASAAEDLGAVLSAAEKYDDAVAQLTDALDGYSYAGAERDLARVRSRLRRLGVRRQPRGTPARPAVGWESLTETERVTAGLVAQGLTNQQAAQQLYVSVHTVAFHLKQVFRKLDIGSRVELARLVAERSPGRGHDRPRGR
jgi:DNA-binding CsgD family transcriptional regulator